MRVQFEKGEQRKFMDEVLKRLACPSLHELINRGVDASYSSLKNYYSERRLMPESLFLMLCNISSIDIKRISAKLINDNWGQSNGGKISRK
jgi:hypothetical protein